MPPFRMTLIEAGPRIRPMLDGALRLKAQATLEGLRHQVLVGQRLMEASETGVTVQTPDGHFKSDRAPTVAPTPKTPDDVPLKSYAEPGNAPRPCGPPEAHPAAGQV